MKYGNQFMNSYVVNHMCAELHHQYQSTVSGNEVTEAERVSTPRAEDIGAVSVDRRIG